MYLKPASPAVNRLDLLLLAAAIAFMYCLLFKFPSGSLFHDSDQLIFLYGAERMYHGEHLYRDFFHFEFPGGRVLYLVLFLIFGVKYWVLGLATLLMGATTFWVTLRISRLLIDGPYAYLPAIVFMFFGMRWLGIDGSHRSFSILFVMIAAWVLLKGGSYYHIATCGVLCALASFFTQQRGLVAVAAFGLFMLIDNYMDGSLWKKALKQILALVISFAAALGALCSYFIATAGWDTFYQSTIVYPVNYYNLHPQNSYSIFIATLKTAFSGTDMPSFFAILPALAYTVLRPLAIAVSFSVFWLGRRSRNWQLWRGPMILAFAGAFLILSTGNPSFLRFFQMSAPSLIIIGWLLSYFDVFAKRKRLVVAALGGTMILVSAVQGIRLQTHWNYAELDTERGKLFGVDGPRFERYFWLRNHTQPGDFVYQVDEPFIDLRRRL